MKSDQNGPQADGAQRPPTGPASGPEPGPGHAGRAEFSGFMDERDERPHADRPARPASDPGQAFGSEPDFARFQPNVRESLLPRWLHLSLLWILGLGAAAALVMAGMFVAQQRKADKTLELLAVSARSMDVPVPPAVVPLAEKKPGDMVFLPAAAQAAPPAQPAPTAQPARSAQPAKLPQAGAQRADAVSQVASPAVAPPSAKPSPPKAASVKAAPAKAKQIAKKKKARAKKATAIAGRGKTQTWPRRRGDSITERLNAAVAACRARPHAPGDCNLRACDILGSSDPACR